MATHTPQGMVRSVSESYPLALILCVVVGTPAFSADPHTTIERADGSTVAVKKIKGDLVFRGPVARAEEFLDSPALQERLRKWSGNAIRAAALSKEERKRLLDQPPLTLVKDYPWAAFCYMVSGAAAARIDHEGLHMKRDRGAWRALVFFKTANQVPDERCARLCGMWRHEYNMLLEDDSFGVGETAPLHSFAPPARIISAPGTFIHNDWPFLKEGTLLEVSLLGEFDSSKQTIVPRLRLEMPDKQETQLDVAALATYQPRALKPPLK